MSESNQLFWKVVVHVLAVLWTIIAVELLLLWLMDAFEEEIRGLLSRIPAVQRYMERCFQESARRGELCICISRTDPETGAVIECIVPIPPSSEVEAGRDEDETKH